MEAPQLLTSLEPELLRGVPLEVCLGGWGRHWKPPEPGMFNVDSNVYDLSRPADHFDDFLSHDWGTSRWAKLVTLLIIYNSRAALCAALLASPLIAVARIAGVLPNYRSSGCLCYVFHLLVLCFWQRLRSALRPSIMVFLDKLCIAQSPEQAELKKKGILGLAAFLNHSRRLVVLWSPRYFTRLWCGYEMAAFLTDHNKQKPVFFMPAAAGFLVLASYVFFGWLTSSLLIVVGGVGSGWGATAFAITEENIWHLVLSGVGLVLVPAVVLGIPTSINNVRLAKTLHQVPYQVRTFEIQLAACFCCSNAHKHPDTGSDIPCDRALVYRKLREWYGRPTDTGEEHLRRFNSMVHRRFGRYVVRQLPSSVPFGPSIYMLVAATTSWLSDAIERVLWRVFMEDGSDRSDFMIFVWRDNVLLYAFVVTTIVYTGLLGFSTSNWVARIAPDMSSLWLGLLAWTLCAVPAVAAFVGFFVLSVSDDVWMPAGLFLGVLVMGSWLVLPKCRRREDNEAGEPDTPLSTPCNSKDSVRGDSFGSSTPAEGSCFRSPSDVSVWSC